MSSHKDPRPFKSRIEALVPIARIGLGAIFVYMGFNKALHPVEFLKLLREYQLTENSTVLNLIAGGLPWFELFTGLLLILGIGVRGAGLLAFGMLVPFTLLIAQRAVALHGAQAISFCAIRFDCGCGAGEVLICRKLTENFLLILVALAIVCVRSPRACLHYSLFRGPTS